MEYLIVIEKAESNWAAYSPDVLGCVATGRTVEETVENMRGALTLHLETMIEDGEELPAAGSQALTIEVNVPGPAGEAASAA